MNVGRTVTGEPQGSPTLFVLKPGASITAGLAAVGSHHGDLNYLDPYGSIGFNAAANKGTSSGQTVLEPGNYVALDTGRTGQPPRPEFTVTRAANPPSLPMPVGAIDFGFTGPSKLHDRELVRFENDGFLVHMIGWASAKNAKTAKKLTAVLRPETTRRPSASPPGSARSQVRCRTATNTARGARRRNAGGSVVKQRGRERDGQRSGGLRQDLDLGRHREREGEPQIAARRRQQPSGKAGDPRAYTLRYRDPRRRASPPRRIPFLRRYDRDGPGSSTRATRIGGNDDGQTIAT